MTRPTVARKIRIVLVDDHQLMREGLIAICRAEPDLDVVGQAENGREALEVAAELDPDVVVMDVAMRELNGIEATRRICERGAVRVLALSTHHDKRYVQRMLQAGASGYVLKAAAFNELREALRCVMQGRVYLSPGLGRVGGEGDGIGEEPAVPTVDIPALSHREQEVLQLLAEGVSSADIARRLHRSVRTIDSHRRSIMRKLDLHTVAELTKHAVRAGLTPLE